MVINGGRDFLSWGPNRLPMDWAFFFNHLLSSILLTDHLLSWTLVCCPRLSHGCRVFTHFGPQHLRCTHFPHKIKCFCFYNRPTLLTPLTIIYQLGYSCTHQTAYIWEHVDTRLQEKDSHWNQNPLSNVAAPQAQFNRPHLGRAGAITDFTGELFIRAPLWWAHNTGWPLSHSLFTTSYHLRLY